MNKIILFVLILYLKGVLLNSCEIHRTCRECIRDASVCVWCYSETYDNEQRCKPSSFVYGNTTWCSDSRENPDNDKTITSNEPFTSNSSFVTQINPQRYQLNLRPGLPLNFSFSFKRSANYPVDIYFLMDSSATMKGARKVTSQQSKNIYDIMTSMTSDVYMGMGTFVDKNMLPYTSKTINNQSYSFKHHHNLTQDYTMFQEAVDAIEIGLNRDAPEAGLDALAQAIICKEKIGWRPQSRKILVLMTDESYHSAGDGRSAGLFKPYDGECYTENNVYINEKEMDYPSVSMINKLARENHVIVIFAVDSDKLRTYTSLADYITGSKAVELNSNNGDIVTQLKKIYEEITTRIKLNVFMASRSARPRNIQISFDPDCTKDLSDCKVTGDDIKTINGTVKVLEYDGHDDATIDVAIEGIAEKLTLDINIKNVCNCSLKPDSNSSYCHGEPRDCGICQCKEPLYGVTCQCSRHRVNSTDTSTCVTGDMAKPCNGRGECSCGACTCQPEYAGPYCECFLKNCPMDTNNVVCGGHGVCQCDETCKCAPGWTGKACECSHDDSTNKLCLAPNNKVCNGRGSCVCGSCECEPIASWDRRKDFSKHCVMNPCPECHSLQCTTLTDCAVCLINEETDCNCAFAKNITIVEKLPENLNDADENGKWQVCSRVRVDLGCHTNFTYKYDEDEYVIHLMLQKNQNCAENYYIFGGIFLICVVLVGVFTLLGWKLITYLRDRQEYAKFMKDHVPDIAPCDNPLYEPASTTFRNPTFGKRSIQY